uniref:DNA cross-link repair 1A protein n=1 Tax=Biomphalaria glabrata TaxID=6526 RepID=A0A2C9JPP3_BIOGL
MAGGSESNEDEIWNYKSGRKNKETNPAVLSCEVKNKCTSVINNDVQVEKTSDLKQDGCLHEIVQPDKLFSTLEVIDVDLLNSEEASIPNKVNIKSSCITKDLNHLIKSNNANICKPEQRRNQANIKSSPSSKPVKQLQSSSKSKSTCKRKNSPLKRNVKTFSLTKSPSSSQGSNCSYSDILNTKCIDDYFVQSSQTLKRKSSKLVFEEVSNILVEGANKKTKCQKEEESDTITVGQNIINDKETELSNCRTQSTDTELKKQDILHSFVDVDILFDNDDFNLVEKITSTSSSEVDVMSDPILYNENMGGFFTGSDLLAETNIADDDKDVKSSLVNHSSCEDNKFQGGYTKPENFNKQTSNPCLPLGKSLIDSVLLSKLNNPSLTKQTSLYSFFKPKFGVQEKTVCAESNRKNKSVLVPVTSCPDLHSGKKNIVSNTSKSASSISTGLLLDTPTTEVEPKTKRDAKKVCPFYKKIPGTAITVDAFRFGVIPGCLAYILTHFHYDHYGGLTKKFSQPIYCSKVTGNLVQKRLGVDEKWINRLPLWQPCQVAGVTLTFMEANHCPGAVIILFELQDGRKILHTGDFRASVEMEQYTMLQNVTISELYLDTTYCNPCYAFPAQREVIDFVVSLVLNFVAETPKTLIVCGAYTIGKERIFHSIAKILDTSICVMSDKKKVLDCLEDDDLKSRTTLDWLKGQVHVLPMGKLNQKGLFEHHSKYPQFTSVLALEPTGWTYQDKLESLQNLKPKWSKNNVTLYGVPYSEHSSYLELKRFVQFLKPKKILPTVNNGNPSARQKMEDIFKQWRQD